MAFTNDNNLNSVDLGWGIISLIRAKKKEIAVKIAKKIEKERKKEVVEEKKMIEQIERMGATEADMGIDPSMMIYGAIGLGALLLIKKFL